MIFEEFCDEISGHISYYLPDYDIEAVKIEKVIKNNGVECTGVIIVLKGENVAPNIYLDYYYMLYKQGRSLDEILTMISHEYEKARSTMERSDFDIDVDNLRENVILKLVNYEKNKNKLSECPYIMYMDMAITFRFIVKCDDTGVASALISNNDLDRWGISIDELYNIAMDNTRRMFPERIRCMDEILPDIEEMCIDEMDRKKLYVLSNTSGVNGATVILYKDVIKDFAGKLGKNLFILPSSIHEMILLCSEDVEKDRLKTLIKEVNKYIVSEVDFLSDAVYFYDLETDKITI